MNVLFVLLRNWSSLSRTQPRVLQGRVYIYKHFIILEGFPKIQFFWWWINLILQTKYNQLVTTSKKRLWRLTLAIIVGIHHNCRVRKFKRWLILSYLLSHSFSVSAGSYCLPRPQEKVRLLSQLLGNDVQCYSDDIHSNNSNIPF